MNVLYGITGSVASTLSLKIVKEIQSRGHNVQMVATFSSLYFLKKRFVLGKLLKQFIGIEKDFPLWLDIHEWPGLNYKKNQTIKHIELREWADVFLIAPLTANTLAKIANGLADNLLTSTVRAWDQNKPIIVAPAMNTKMWQQPITAWHLKLLTQNYPVQIVEPVPGKLACGDTGIGALAPITTIIDAVEQPFK